MAITNLVLVFSILLLIGRINEIQATPLLIPKLINVTQTRANAGGGWPIILIPGDGGSQLEAKLNKTQQPHYVCYKTSDWYTIWLNLEQLLPPLIVDCWVHNMMLNYDNATHTTRNNDGVQIRVPGWGDTDSVAYIDPSQWSLSQYFHAIIDMAVSLGYTKGKNIRGAPYDFRKSPNEFKEYYENLTTLIEETYYQNGNKKVIIIAHSMGNPVMLHFYHSKPQAWKDKFLKTHIGIAGPWGGSVKTLLLFASGYNLDHYRIIVNPLQVRSAQRSMTSSAYLLPSPVFWSSNETLIATENRNYTVDDYQQFFNDIKYPTGWDMYQDMRPYHEYDAPGLEVHCMVGTQLTTPSKLVYGKGAFPDTQPQFIYGDGDGTVNLQSAQGCLRWVGKQKQQVFYSEYPKQEHLDLLASPDVVGYIKKLLMAPANEWSSTAKNLNS